MHAVNWCGFIMLAGSSLNAFSNCRSSLGGLSALSVRSLLGLSIYILSFHQFLLCFIVFPYNCWLSPTLWLFLPTIQGHSRMLQDFSRPHH